MNDISLGALFAILAFLILLSGFFSGSETALMSINRYRLKHLAKNKHAGALRVSKLLERPDRLIGIILLGNNFVNILASSLSTVIALKLIKDFNLDITAEIAIAASAGVLTFVILIFAEVTPKTLSALNPEKIAFPASFIYIPLLKIFYPVVYITNAIANKLISLSGSQSKNTDDTALSSEELKTVVLEAGSLIPKPHQKMLLGILDLEKALIEDIMVPRREVLGININDSTEQIINQISNAKHTKLPIYEETLDNIKGVLHIRKALHAILNETFEKSILLNLMREPYFIPEGTSLTRQLLYFQQQRRRTAVVVNEYGDVNGLLTIEDILEEIVGEFNGLPTSMRNMRSAEDGCIIVDGTEHIRELNRRLGLKLPTNGPKTLNGLILEHFEDIPESGISLKLAGNPVEILQIQGNTVKTVKFYDIKR
jgi:Mg2+/Co2+ transporter CorB